MVFWLGWGVCFLFVVGVVLLVRSSSQGGFCTSGVVLFMGNIHEEFLAAREQKYSDYMDRMNSVWFRELGELNKLSVGWSIEQTGGMICVFAFYFDDSSKYEDGHFLMVSPENSLGVDREDELNGTWLVGHYGGETGNDLNDCFDFGSFGDAVKEVERLFFVEGVQ